MKWYKKFESWFADLPGGNNKALEILNKELDALWNHKAQRGVPEHFKKRLTAAQKQCSSALK